MKITPRFVALAALYLLTSVLGHAETAYYKYVDPFIGSVSPGNVVVGPSCPFGMVKPGPDCSKFANNGYRADQTIPVSGFSQVHVSGTGGGPKYGNISVMPFTGEPDGIKVSSLREEEAATLGLYAVQLKKWNVKTEITASRKVAFYRFQYQGAGTKGIKLDAGAFLGGSDDGAELPETQSLVGSEIELLSNTEVQGYGRVRGGWNNGGAYTVYFYAVFDQPFQRYETWADETVYPGKKEQVDTGQKTGALLHFEGAASRPLVQMKIGISFVSSAKARANVNDEIAGWGFEDVLAQTRQKWEKLLSRIEVDPKAPDSQKRMFYTALYHTMLMPVDRSDENPLWKPTGPYYDDFYAIWDTYRSSHPLITLIDPQRQTNIVNALLNIYQHDGYLPDARSGNANGRTQGGSNAEVLIADAYVKGLKGIDYKLALQAMLKDADVPPGGNEEKEGRGGLRDYNSLGYVSTSFPRAGTRTVEYAFDDFCIATVAKGLGEKEIYERFSRQANNWKNLWRDYTDLGAAGFIMPKDANGKWVDLITPTVKGREHEVIPFTPGYVNLGKIEHWWAGFLYEGRSWEYSLSIPHDVAGLIERCGGPEAFKNRLDAFFGSRYYYVGNEPAFLSSTLYHWVGKPELSSERIHAIINKSYSDQRDGIPGNDDSGAMSSWLAFHLLGLYPNAGQSYYLINTPFFAESVWHLADGKDFKVVAKNLSPENRYVKTARLNAQPLPRAWIEHAEITAGGLLELEMTDQPSGWGSGNLPPSLRFEAGTPPAGSR